MTILLTLILGVIAGLMTGNACSKQHRCLGLEGLKAINQRLKEGGKTFHLSGVKGPIMDERTVCSEYETIKFCKSR